jgi:hypothetical protein
MPQPSNNFYRFAAGFLSIIAISVAIIIATTYFKEQSGRVPDCAPLCMN